MADKPQEAAAMEPAGIEIKKPKVRKSEALWLMTFTDLSFLLLCFFVLLLSFSEPKKDKYDKVATGMTAKSVSDQRQPNLAEIEERLKKAIARSQLKGVAAVSLSSEGLRLEFKDAALFASGSARPNPRYRRVVGKVLQVIAKTPDRYEIVIEGHTDDVPIPRGGRFRSNWELASARGVTMLEIFEKRGVSEERMSVEAFAHTRPKVPYKGLRGRKLRAARAQNRRVVIRIE